MDNPKTMKFYDRVVDLYIDLGIQMQQETQLSMNGLLELHKDLPYKSPVFKTNYYSFLFIKDGKGNYTSDEITFDYEGCTIYFTNPGHIKAFEFFEIKEGYLLTFSEEFLKTYVSSKIFEEFPFLLSETIPPQHPNPEEYKDIENIYLQILKEHQANSGYKNKIIGSLLMILLLKIKALFWEDYEPLKEGNQGSKIVTDFKENLERHYQDLMNNRAFRTLSSKDYADLQNLVPSYFSQVIKTKTGRTPSKWIAEKTISLAKSQLIHNSKNIKEIAFQCGFEETSHFSHFFKKETGESPSNYRKNHNN